VTLAPAAVPRTPRRSFRSLFEFLCRVNLTAIPPAHARRSVMEFEERLRAQASPYILRRTKRTVAPELPAKTRASHLVRTHPRAVPAVSRNAGKSGANSSISRRAAPAKRSSGSPR